MVLGPKSNVVQTNCLLFSILPFDAATGSVSQPSRRMRKDRTLICLIWPNASHHRLSQDPNLDECTTAPIKNCLFHFTPDLDVDGYCLNFISTYMDCNISYHRSVTAISWLFLLSRIVYIVLHPPTVHTGGRHGC